ncbi:MAG: YbaK/EbsC family protein [Spirochaetaceae bacterium]|jgi:prolyl-tRNA editing enzyme YbaK/EbsC (Cys-tRNA(Pro) deacylase)|nr:YbaK/EbsC family protein [Spirochaetaceae bacterium]
MAIERVRQHLARWGRDTDILEAEESSATVALAAEAFGVIPARIAKSLSFKVPLQDASAEQSAPGAMLLVCAGDAKVDNKKFRERFGFKASMLTPDEALNATGHAVGGVCPFGIPEEVAVFLDISLQRFQTVFPACGSANSAIEVTPEELAEYSGPAGSAGWVDVCKIPE